MHWDFFTVLSVLSGIVLIAAALAGPVVGTVRERLGIFAFGVFSFSYGIWVATQSSGFYVFSVAPAGVAVTIIVRAVQHAAKGGKPPGTADATGARPGSAQTASRPGVSPPAVSALRMAQPDRVRGAVRGGSTAFCPAFQLPDSAPGDQVALGWSTEDGRPRLTPGEETLGIWQANVRIKVAIDKGLKPSPARHGVTWVTVVDGTGLIAVSKFRVAGVIVRGDSLLGVFDEGAGNALWSLPLLRLSSVEATEAGLFLSSADPAGHVTLTGITAAEGGGSAVTAEQVAELINRTRAELSGSA